MTSILIGATIFFCVVQLESHGLNLTEEQLQTHTIYLLGKRLSFKLVIPMLSWKQDDWLFIGPQLEKSRTEFSPLHYISNFCERCLVVTTFPNNWFSRHCFWPDSERAESSPARNRQGHRALHQSHTMSSPIPTGVDCIRPFIWNTERIYTVVELWLYRFGVS